MNPFPIYNYVNPKYFCNRISETERVISAVTNKRNIILFSENGIGKTTLIKHVAEELKELDNYRFIYVSLLKTENTYQFVNALFNSVFTKKNREKKLKNLFPELKFLMNQKDSLISKQIVLQEKEIDLSEILEKLILFLTKKNQNVIIALDDFQNLPLCLNKNQTAIIKRFFNDSENFSFILSSNNIVSVENFLEDDLGKTEIIELQKIERKKYKRFIKKRFVKEKIKIDNESIEFILNWSKKKTFYTHYICNKIYDSGNQKINIGIVKKIIGNILKEYEYVFLEYRRLLSKYQWKLLTAIAKAGDEAKITSIKFIEFYNLNAPSSVKTAINALIEKGLVVRKQKSYHIANVFLEQWIKRFYN